MHLFITIITGLILFTLLSIISCFYFRRLKTKYTLKKIQTFGKSLLKKEQILNYKGIEIFIKNSIINECRCILGLFDIQSLNLEKYTNEEDDTKYALLNESVYFFIYPNKPEKNLLEYPDWLCLTQNFIFFLENFVFVNLSDKQIFIKINSIKEYIDTLIFLDVFFNLKSENLILFLEEEIKFSDKITPLKLLFLLSYTKLENITFLDKRTNEINSFLINEPNTLFLFDKLKSITLLSDNNDCDIRLALKNKENRKIEINLQNSLIHKTKEEILSLEIKMKKDSSLEKITYFYENYDFKKASNSFLKNFANLQNENAISFIKSIFIFENPFFLKKLRKKRFFNSTNQKEFMSNLENIKELTDNNLLLTLFYSEKTTNLRIIFNNLYNFTDVLITHFIKENIFILDYSDFFSSEDSNLLIEYIKSINKGVLKLSVRININKSHDLIPLIQNQESIFSLTIHSKYDKSSIKHISKLLNYDLYFFESVRNMKFENITVDFAKEEWKNVRLPMKFDQLFFDCCNIRNINRLCSNEISCSFELHLYECMIDLKELCLLIEQKKILSFVFYNVKIISNCYENIDYFINIEGLVLEERFINLKEYFVPKRISEILQMYILQIEGFMYLKMQY